MYVWPNTKKKKRGSGIYTHLVFMAGASKEVTHSVGNHRCRRDDAVRRPIKRRLEKPDDDDDDDDDDDEEEEEE